MEQEAIILGKTNFACFFSLLDYFFEYSYICVIFRISTEISKSPRKWLSKKGRQMFKYKELFSFKIIRMNYGAGRVIIR